jgi:hypothetical protein
VCLTFQTANRFGLSPLKLTRPYPNSKARRFLTAGSPRFAFLPLSKRFTTAVFGDAIRELRICRHCVNLSFCSFLCRNHWEVVLLRMLIAQIRALPDSKLSPFRSIERVGEFCYWASESLRSMTFVAHSKLSRFERSVFSIT